MTDKSPPKPSYAKPSQKSPYRAEYLNGSGWRVIGPDEGPTEAVYASKSAAAGVAGTLNRNAALAAKRMTRPCMCCQTPFKSAGIHNRLCPRCRLGATESRPMSFVNPARRYG